MLKEYFTEKYCITNCIQASTHITYSPGFVKMGNIFQTILNTCLRCSDGGGHILTHKPRVRKSKYKGIPSSEHSFIIRRNCKVLSAIKAGLKLDIIVFKISELEWKAIRNNMREESFLFACFHVFHNAVTIHLMLLLEQCTQLPLKYNPKLVCIKSCRHS